MTKNEFNNLKAGDVVYQVISNYETELPIIEQCVAVGICESETEWIVRPYDRNKDYSWANRYSLFLTRREAEEEAILTMQRRIEANKKDLNALKSNIKKLESNLLKFYQNCIEIESETEIKKPDDESK